MFAVIYCPIRLCKIKAGDCDDKPVCLWDTEVIEITSTVLAGSKACHSKSPLSTLNYVSQ